MIVPVNYYVLGCPPRPQAIVTALAKALGVTLEEKEDYWMTPEGFRSKHEIDGENVLDAVHALKYAARTPSNCLKATENA